jgi:hypothetical protein
MQYSIFITIAYARLIFNPKSTKHYRPEIIR